MVVGGRRGRRCREEPLWNLERGTHTRSVYSYGEWLPIKGNGFCQCLGKRC
jgi:hypothetical protein